MTLAVLPLEILAIITENLSIIEICRLAQTGDKILTTKLHYGGVQELEMGNLPWTDFASKFPNLRVLRRTYGLADGMPPADSLDQLESLPTTITRLVKPNVQSFDAIRRFTQLTHLVMPRTNSQNPIVLDRPLGINCAHFESGSFPISSIPMLGPGLASLSIREEGGPPWTPTTFLIGWGNIVRPIFPHLTSLSVSGRPPKFGSLPPTLTSLRVSSIYWTADWSSIPANLETLEVSGVINLPTPEQIQRDYPPNLKNLVLVAGSMAKWTRNHSKSLPRSLLSLRNAIQGATVSSHWWDEDSIMDLPDSLTDFGLVASSWPDCSKLPRGLTNLEFSTMTHPYNLSQLPQGLKILRRIPLPPSCLHELPSTLTELSCILTDQVPVGDWSALLQKGPQREWRADATRLSAGITSLQVSSDSFFSLEDWLPPRLLSLRLDFSIAERVRQVVKGIYPPTNWLSHLPSSLTSLSIHGLVGHNDDIHYKYIAGPKSLKELSIINNCSMDSAPSMDSTWFQHLPRTLEQLRLTFADTFDQRHMKDLPPHLRELRIDPRRSSTTEVRFPNITPEILLLIPDSVNRFIIPIAADAQTDRNEWARLAKERHVRLSRNHFKFVWHE
jgi:hypothetical protein